MEPDAWVPLAEIARPHGVRGELRLKLFNKDSDTLLGLDEVLVRLPDGKEHEVSVEKARRADDAILMKLYSVDDRDRADELRGSLICARRRDFPEVDEGEFYAVDVVGAEVFHEGKRVGLVKELLTYPAASVLLVTADDGEGDYEFPLSAPFVSKVDPKAKRVEVLTLEDVPRDTPKKPKAPAQKPRKYHQKTKA